MFRIPNQRHLSPGSRTRNPAMWIGTARAALGWAAALVLTASGCGGPSGSDAPSAALDDVVDWGREIHLEENEEVINVRPVVRFDPRGGFLVADAQESQFRRYGASGDLLAVFGRRGGGPGEFRSPAAVVRLRDGTLVGFDEDGRYAQFDSAGGSVLRAGRVPVPSISSVEVVDDTTLLSVVGLGTGPRLNTWIPFSDRVERSFFTPPFRRISASVHAAVGAGGIAATFLISDTIYIFGPDGEERMKVPFRTERYRPYADPSSWPPPPDWQYSFSILSRADWLPDGTLLVRYGRFTESGTVWSLANVTLDGVVRFDLADVPQLLTVGGDGRELVFVAPGADAPNVWRVGAYRAAGRR